MRCNNAEKEEINVSWGFTTEDINFRLVSKIRYRYSEIEWGDYHLQYSKIQKMVNYKSPFKTMQEQLEAEMRQIMKVTAFKRTQGLWKGKRLRVRFWAKNPHSDGVISSLISSIFTMCLLCAKCCSRSSGFQSEK